MNTTKIEESEISALKISSLPSRPTAPASFGGRGYTSKEMKEAFDKLPLFIIEKFNSLIDDISSSGDASLAASIPTGIEEGHTLRELFLDIVSGRISEYLPVGDIKLSELGAAIDEGLEKIEEAIGNFPSTHTTAPNNLLMKKAHIYRLGTKTSLSISVPPDINPEYYSEVSFDSGADATVFTAVSKIRLTGDDVADEELLPKENTHYTIFLWYDGDVQGVVRGIPNEA